MAQSYLRAGRESSWRVPRFRAAKIGLSPSWISFARWEVCLWSSRRAATIRAEPPLNVQPAAVEAAPKRPAPPNPKLVKLPFSFPRGMENTPVVFRGRVLLVQNDRSIKQDEQEKAYLFIQDMVTGQEVARLGTGLLVRQCLCQRRGVERLRHGEHEQGVDQGHLPLLVQRSQVLEAGVGDPPGGRRAPVQHVGLPRRARLPDGVRIQQAGAVELPVCAVEGSLPLGEGARDRVRRRRGPDGVRQPDHPLLRPVLLRDLWHLAMERAGNRLRIPPAGDEIRHRGGPVEGPGPVGTEPHAASDARPDPRAKGSTTPTPICSSSRATRTSTTRRATRQPGARFASRCMPAR